MGIDWRGKMNDGDGDVIGHCNIEIFRIKIEEMEMYRDRWNGSKMIGSILVQFYILGIPRIDTFIQFKQGHEMKG